METKNQIPLRWPDGWGRTLIDHRKPQAAWKRPMAYYRDAVLKELERVGVTAATISYNEVGKERIDPGVAVWFSLKPKEDFSWQAGLKLDNPAPSLDEIDAAFRQLVRNHHPDAVAAGSGGDIQMFHRLQEYRKQARAWVLGSNALVLDNCIPCDRFKEIRQNLAAISQALAAFRKLDRVGIPEPPSPARKLAEEIAADLFTSGLTNEKAWQLALMNHRGEYVSGWSESALAVRIEKHLTKKRRCK